MNGLDISEQEFSSMLAKNQRLVLFKNSQKSIGLIKSYSFHKKVQYAWLTALTTVGIFIIKYIFTSK